jgi:hypothetical protein
MVKKGDKRGWLRIVEASIAILMVLSSLMIINNGISKRQEVAMDDNFYSLLDKMAENTTLRGKILSYDITNPSNYPGNYQVILDLNNFFANELQDRAVNYSVSICGIAGNCDLEKNIGREVYSAERIIATNLTSSEFSERRIRIYWGSA